jgi:hypothetical protein
VAITIAQSPPNPFIERCRKTATSVAETRRPGEVTLHFRGLRNPQQTD